MSGKKLFLVGDNPFHGVSHLSQERSISRGNRNNLSSPSYAADLVSIALRNGADGFMFTVNESTLSILKLVSKNEGYDQLRLYAIVPHVPEFVRLAATSGGIPGLAMKLGRQIAFSRNFGAATNALKGAIANDPSSLLKSYLLYEKFRLKAAMGKKAALSSIMWHEVITDMALALNMRWLFEVHIDFMMKHKIKPGFETRNFAYLIKKFEEWQIDFSKVAIAAPFNAIGFQMCPSRDECEKAIARHPEAEIIGFSILAAGYLKLPEAASYVINTSMLTGIAVGVSKEYHAEETFKVLAELTETKKGI